MRNKVLLKFQLICTLQTMLKCKDQKIFALSVFNVTMYNMHKLIKIYHVALQL